jgi:hypothetical protein
VAADTAVMVVRIDSAGSAAGSTPADGTSSGLASHWNIEVDAACSADNTDSHCWG